ncbi:hypothetical protein PsYK624_123870 [Phanerochaete sordida]|uniref:Uncharacterized protein n=1 Tax=Phanerochaete sordida TaxID=48140 RepID=A0A9P3GL01_9APHY|nr:hypothetical protein PsYK624_123870 [Phanerochaete sordida]
MSRLENEKTVYEWFWTVRPRPVDAALALSFHSSLPFTTSTDLYTDSFPNIATISNTTTGTLLIRPRRTDVLVCARARTRTMKVGGIVTSTSPAPSFPVLMPLCFTAALRLQPS